MAGLKTAASGIFVGGVITNSYSTRDVNGVKDSGGGIAGFIMGATTISN
jgi:hypothetical protein